MVKDIFAKVYHARKKNEDVYKWPGPVSDAWYIVEELTELMRGVQRIYYPDHIRNSDLDMDLDTYLHTEWGQTLMMLITLGIELELDGDRALELATQKIYTTSEKERSSKT